jgi:nitric oxide synthase-interacting protein
MTPMSDNQNDQSKKLVQCYVCDADLLDRGRTSEKHMVRPGLVLIKSDGTGFSAGGGIVTTEKQGIAFQC